jgi:hypothetical protein
MDTDTHGFETGSGARSNDLLIRVHLCPSVVKLGLAPVMAYLPMQKVAKRWSSMRSWSIFPQRVEDAPEIAGQQLRSRARPQLALGRQEALPGPPQRLGVPGVDRDDLLALQNLKRVRPPGDGLDQRLQPQTRERGDLQRLKARRARAGQGTLSQKVDLVQDNHGVRRVHSPRNLRGQGRDRSIGIHHPENKIRISRPFQGLGDAHLFNGSGVSPQPSGVDEPEGVGTNQNRLLQIVPGRARFRADQRALVSNQPIEQAALARIGLAQNDRPDPAAQQVAIAMRGQQSVRST